MFFSPRVPVKKTHCRNSIARSCRLPEIGTHASQLWNQRLRLSRKRRFSKVGTHGRQPGHQKLPLQGTAGSQRLELLATRGYHCKELPVPRGWNSCFPTWEPLVTIASNCRLPGIGTPGCQPWNQWLPLQVTSGSQRLELMVRYRFVLFNEPVAERFVFA